MQGHKQAGRTARAPGHRGSCADQTLEVHRHYAIYIRKRGETRAQAPLRFLCSGARRAGRRLGCLKGARSCNDAALLPVLCAAMPA